MTEIQTSTSIQLLADQFINKKFYKVTDEKHIITVWYVFFLSSPRHKGDLLNSKLLYIKEEHNYAFFHEANDTSFGDTVLHKGTL